MKIVIAVLAMMPLLAHAAPSAALDLSGHSTVYRPFPNPPCGDFIDDCERHPKPWEDCRYAYCSPGRPRPRPLEGMNDKVSGITGSIGKGNIALASQGLDGLYSGSGLIAGGHNAVSNEGAVYAGTWTIAPPLPQVDRMGAAAISSLSREKAVPAPTFHKIACGDKDGCKSEVGKTYEDIVEGLTTPLRLWVERDRTQESRDTYGGCRMKGTCSK